MSFYVFRWSSWAISSVHFDKKEEESRRVYIYVRCTREKRFYARIMFDFDHNVISHRCILIDQVVYLFDISRNAAAVHNDTADWMHV